MTLVWREEMALDHGIIDDDHKCLIAVVNEMELVRPGVGMRRELEHILTRLACYAEVHFEREERLQIASAFLYAQAHRMRHRSQARGINALLLECRGVSWERLPEFREDLCCFLYDWLRDHILKADLMMKPWLDSMRKDGQGDETLADAMLSKIGSENTRRAMPHRQLPLPSGSFHRPH